MNISARSNRAPAAPPFPVQEAAPKAHILSAHQAVDIAAKLNGLEQPEAVHVLEGHADCRGRSSLQCARSPRRGQSCSS
jgi:hypothetical protein